MTFIFHNIWDNPSQLTFIFFRGLKPPIEHVSGKIEVENLKFGNFEPRNSHAYPSGHAGLCIGRGRLSLVQKWFLSTRCKMFGIPQLCRDYVQPYLGWVFSPLTGSHNPPEKRKCCNTLKEQGNITARILLIMTQFLWYYHIWSTCRYQPWNYFGAPEILGRNQATRWCFNKLDDG